MSTTLFAQDMLNTPVGFAMAGLVGMLFGWFLEQAGFGSSRRLTGIFYFRDMGVLKVMFSAVVTAMVGYRYLVAFGWLDPAGVLGLDTYWGAQAVGGLVFGAGFVIGGWCPGTAAVGMASAKWDAFVFLGGALLGTVFFNEIYDTVRPLYEGACPGVIYLGDTVGLPASLVVLLFCGVAILAFAGSAYLERRFGGLPLPEAPTRQRRRRAAALLLLLAVGGLLLPTPPPTAAAAAAAPTPLLTEVAAAVDHIDPPALADRMAAGDPGLLVVDIRPAADYAAFHLRGAISLPLEQLPAQAASRLPRTGTVVLYSNGTTHAAQAWLAMRQAGWTNVLVLTDGILAFWRECLTPPSLAGLPDEHAARAAAGAYAARLAYFLPDRAAAQASPPTVPPAAAPAPPAALVEPGLEQHLVATDWLAAHLTEPGVKVVDVRAKSTDYTSGHIPGALYLGVESLRATLGGVPAMLLPADDIARALGRLGIRATDTVVVYSDALRDATLASLALNRVGHASFAVLHGGVARWKTDGQPLDKALPTVVPVTYTQTAAADTVTVAADEVRAATGDGRTVILDVRPADYYAGRKSEEARAGHIPGAVNREFKLDLVPEREVWQDEAVLRQAYAALGITADTPVIVHCRTGHQASQTWFLLKHLLGVKDVRWYDGSWSDWAARPDLPVAK